MTFTSIDFGGERQPKVAPLLKKGNELMKVWKLVNLQLACGKVQLDRGGSIPRRQLIRVLNYVGIRIYRSPLPER